MREIIKDYTIGVDIGGTNIKAVLFNNEKGKIIESDSLVTPKDNIEHFYIMINALIEPFIKKAFIDKIKIKGIGLSVAGLINHKEKIVIKSPNIPILNGVNIVKKLEEKLKLPIFIANDTDCFLHAEVKYGVANKYKNVYGIILGTGIGGAWWINDKIYKGSNSGAGELGRIIINFLDPTDIESIYQKLSQNNPEQMAEEAYGGDNLAEKSYEEIGKFLGIAFANIVNLIDPEIIVVGGSLIKSSDLFMSEINKSMKEYIMNPESKKIKILKSKLGEYSGAIGASLLAV